jgi:steroid delta-isomerase-like uncharacterized protein
MAVADIASITQAYYEAFNAHDWDRVASYFSDRVEWANVATGETFQGHDGMMQWINGWVSAFPDAHVQVVHQVVGADAVATQFRGQGTQTAPLQTAMGEIPATGRTVDIPFCEVFQLQGGKVARVDSYFDVATMLRQLGVTA